MNNWLSKIFNCNMHFIDDFAKQGLQMLKSKQIIMLAANTS